MATVFSQMPRHSAMEAKRDGIAATWEEVVIWSVAVEIAELFILFLRQKGTSNFHQEDPVHISTPQPIGELRLFEVEPRCPEFVVGVCRVDNRFTTGLPEGLAHDQGLTSLGLQK